MLAWAEKYIIQNRSLQYFFDEYIYPENFNFSSKVFPPIEESSNINPYDKIGIAMAKKMKVPIYFKKGKNQSIKTKKLFK